MWSKIQASLTLKPFHKQVRSEALLAHALRKGLLVRALSTPPTISQAETQALLNTCAINQSLKKTLLTPHSNKENLL
jgi:hypothetical protein